MTTLISRERSGPLRGSVETSLLSSEAHFSEHAATGGSAIKAVEVLIDHGIPQERIIFLNLVSCPEGLQAMYSAYPQVKVVTAWVDDGLDSHKYIVPGLGGQSRFRRLRCLLWSSSQ